MPAFVDRTNVRYGNLIAINLFNEKINGHLQWICKCDCGNTVIVPGVHLVTGNTKSCGCRKIETSRQNGSNNKTHGMTGTSEYKAWQSLRDRCYNVDSQQYNNYGARGIRVCNRWLNSFENFYADMGPKPSSIHSIDRMNNNGDYEPENCYWATPTQQSNNKRTNCFHELNGEMLTVAQIAKKENIPVATLVSRLNRDNLSIEEAINKKANKHKFTYNGVTKSLNEWAHELNIGYNKLYTRIFTLGWSFEKAISKEGHRRIIKLI